MSLAIKVRISALSYHFIDGIKRDRSPSEKPIKLKLRGLRYFPVADMTKPTEFGSKIEVQTSIFARMALGLPLLFTQEWQPLDVILPRLADYQSKHGILKNQGLSPLLNDNFKGLANHLIYFSAVGGIAAFVIGLLGFFTDNAPSSHLMYKHLIWGGLAVSIPMFLIDNLIHNPESQNFYDLVLMLNNRKTFYTKQELDPELLKRLGIYRK